MERGEVKILLKYIPYILLFALVTMIIYAWGLWRSMRQQQDLSNLLSAKGISKVKKALKKNGAMSAKELEPVVKGLSAKQPFTREKIEVTDPVKFLGSIMPYMINQKLISETQKNGKAVYQLRK